MENKVTHITDKNWKLVDSNDERHGRCTVCDDRVWVTVYTYIDWSTRKKRYKRERSTCTCDL